MNKAALTEADLSGLLSDYLLNGRAQERWTIKSVEVEDDRLVAEIAMVETYVSDTDEGGFHLTIFSSLEFLSQLMIIYAHIWAGMDEKVREGWMVESSIKCLGSIRSATNIRVEMDVLKMRKRGPNLYCHANFTISDDLSDARFEASLKGFLS